MPLIELLGAVGELVLPRACAGCRTPGIALCPGCLPAGPPGPAVVAGLTVVTAGDYRDGLRAALIAYKERGRTELARPLGRLLAAAVQAVGALEAVEALQAVEALEAAGAAGARAGPVCLVPVPSAARARRERGGDHVLRLARAAARGSGLPVSRALRLERAVRDSAGLDRGERAANLAGAFAATQPPAGRRAIVVDDIVTTGTTLREAARALELAGWPEPVAAVVAATPRRHDTTRRGIWRGGGATSTVGMT